MANLFSAFSSWCYEGFLRSPSVMINPIAISGSCHFENGKPFSQSFGNTINDDMFDSTGIKIIFLSSYPSAVFRTIISVVINTVYCQMFFVTFFHILIKSFKRIFPRWTNSDTSSAIVFICFIFLVITASFYSTPNSINFGFGQIMNFEMVFPAQTSTTFTFASYKVVADDLPFLATITNTKKQKLSSFSSSSRLLNCPSTESFADNIRFQDCSFASTHIDAWHYNINIKGVQIIL